MDTTPNTLSLVAYENPLTGREDDFYLRVKRQKQTLGIAELAREAAALLGKYGEDEIALIANSLERVKCDAVANGYTVATPTCRLMPTATGSLTRAELTKPVDRNVVKVRAALSQGPLLKQTMQDCGLEVFTQPAVIGPVLCGAVAYARTATGQLLPQPPKPGKTLTLIGRNLKLAGTDPSVGVTFTLVDEPHTVVRLGVEDMAVNQPKRLIFVLPHEVTDGLWMVAVTTQSTTGGHTVKYPRTCTLDTPLSVGEDGWQEGREPIPSLAT